MPAYRCTIVDGGPQGRLGPFLGVGCHLSPEVALARALTEAAQSRLTFIAGSRDDMFPEHYVPALPSTRPARDDVWLDFRSRRPPPLGRTFEEDLQTTLALLGAAGFPRVVAVDHTRPEFQIPVVTVVIPGLREIP